MTTPPIISEELPLTSIGKSEAEAFEIIINSISKALLTPEGKAALTLITIAALIYVLIRTLKKDKEVIIEEKQSEQLYARQATGELITLHKEEREAQRESYEVQIQAISKRLSQLEAENARIREEAALEKERLLKKSEEEREKFYSQVLELKTQNARYDEQLRAAQQELSTVRTISKGLASMVESLRSQIDSEILSKHGKDKVPPPSDLGVENF